ncbi:MAG: YbaB/EbfC family nucleoid-associated protein [Desulfovibrio sp.]|nr:YbaB/EbfC family nucleoid-associated protein [Desulfovibrio sp.]
MPSFNNDIFRQAQVLQNKVSKVEEKLVNTLFEASSGGGMVKAGVLGSLELKKLTIDPKALTECDVEMLQDLIVAAVSEAQRIATEIKEREIEKVTSGIKLPLTF